MVTFLLLFQLGLGGAPQISDPSNFTATYEALVPQWIAAVYPYAQDLFWALAGLDLAVFGWTLIRRHGNNIPGAILSTANRLVIIGAFLALLSNGSVWMGYVVQMFIGFWNAFAIDLDGLDQNYATQLNDSNENASDAGWGREILAPAPGTVVYARNDVPTNPHPGEEPDFNSWYLPLHDPVMAYAGNCIIIDHGNSEYSVMMHMQPGSVIVKAGDQVAKGQVIGRLGNSGDAFGPHLHYQLQSGPQLFQYQSLPFKFQNIDVPQLSRGTYFDAK